MNGRLIPQQKAGLSLTDLSILRGLGVFDFFRTYQGVPFELEAHWKRLENSAQKLNLKVPHNLEEIQEIIEELLFLRNDRATDIGFRMVLTGGEAAFGTFYQEKPNFFILSEPIQTQNIEIYTKGIKIISKSYQRNFPEIKTLDYLATFYFKPEIEKAGAQDVLYCADNQVSECSRSNIFIIQGNTLITPDANILVGITRNIILELASKMMKVVQRTVSLEEVYQADEIFVTGTRSEAKPVIQVDDKIIGDGQVGKYSKAIRKALLEKIRIDCTIV